MVTAERDFHRSHRRVYAVRRSRTADRPWRHPQFAGDVVLALFGLYVLYLLASVVASLP